MSQKVYSIVLFTVCVIIVHVFDTYALYLPNSVYTDSPNAPASSSVLPPGVTPNAPASSSVLPPGATPNAPASSSALPSGVTPNAFTKAVLALPILKDFLHVKINRYEAGDIIYHMESVLLLALGYPDAPIAANNEALLLARFHAFTIPAFIHLKGNTLEKFLDFQGIEVAPRLVQNYANSIEHSLKSSLINSPTEVLRAIEEGYINFIQSLGFSFREQAYVLSLIFNEEVNANIKLAEEVKKS